MKPNPVRGMGLQRWQNTVNTPVVISGIFTCVCIHKHFEPYTSFDRNTYMHVHTHTYSRPRQCWFASVGFRRPDSPNLPLHIERLIHRGLAEYRTTKKPLHKWGSFCSACSSMTELRIPLERLLCETWNSRRANLRSETSDQIRGLLTVLAEVKAAVLWR